MDDREKGEAMPDALKPARDFVSNRPMARTHGHTSNRLYKGGASPTYQSWLAMRVRCLLPGRENADRYKDLGISICERWSVFENFLADMGERPTGTSLDRFPNNAGNYEPGNCRWATPREQARNTRRNKLTLESAIQVAFRRLSGESCPSIAADFGISESLPREIVKGRTWPDALAAAQKMLEKKA